MEVSARRWLLILASRQRNPWPRSLVLDQQARLRTGHLLAIPGFALLRLLLQNLTDSLRNGHLSNHAKAYAKIDEQQKSLRQRLQKMSEDDNQTLKVVLATGLNDKLEVQAEEHREQEYGQMLGDCTTLQDGVKQLRKGLSSLRHVARLQQNLTDQKGGGVHKQPPQISGEQVLSKLSR